MKQDPHREGINTPNRLEKNAIEEAVARLLRLAGPRAPVPTERNARVMAAVKSEWRSAVRRRTRRIVWLGAAATVSAAAALLLAFVVWRGALFQSREDPIVAVLQRTEGPVWLTQRIAADETDPPPVSRTGGALTAGAWIETSASGRAALRLHQGASLRLDVSTQTRLVSDAQILLKRGAVYVDSGDETTRSRLEIRTAMGVARDFGTQFELRLTTDALRLRVREGRVDLNCAGRIHAAREGEELRLVTESLVERGTIPISGPLWGWTQEIAPDFALEGRSLRTFLEWYARETRYAIDARQMLSLMHVDRVILHGAIEGLTPQEALQAVLPTCGLSHRIIGDVLVIEPSTETLRSARAD